MLLLGGNGDGRTRSLNVSQHIGIDGIMVECTDIPGRDLARASEECLPLLEASDVIAVVVDTPSLMEASTEDSGQVNRVEEIQHLLHGVNGKDKMVIFVPVRCEKWMQERRMKEVLDKLVSVYYSSLKSLYTYRRTECCIIPTESIDDALHHCGQPVWHAIKYMAKEWAAATKALRRLGMHYLVHTKSEILAKRIEELESEGVIINYGDYILIDHWHEIPVIMENFDEVYRKLPDTKQ